MMRHKPFNNSSVAFTALAASILISALLIQPHQAIIQYIYLNQFHFTVTVRILKAGQSEWHTIMKDKLNVLTTIGKNKIELELGDAGTTDEANYISLTESATAPDASWTILPSEIATGGLTRALGAYASTGDGAWTIIKTFTASSGFTVRAAGLNWASSGDNNLLAAVAFGTVATLASGDSLEVTWTCSVA